MATTQKIKEGVFLILWESPNHRGLNKETVKIDEISLTFQLSYTINHDTPTTELVMQISPISRKTLQNPGILECTRLSYHVSLLSLRQGIRRELNLVDTKWVVKLFNVDVKSAMIFDIVVDFTNNLPLPTSKRVLDYVLNLWETKTLADVTFKFKEKDIQAHASILATGSPVLAAMFQNNFKGKLEKIIEIKDIEPSVFEFMLRFFYTGAADLEKVDAVELFVVADKYGVEALKEECASNLALYLTVENVADYLKLARLYPELMNQSFARDFLVNNSKTICFREDWKEIVENYPEMAFQAMQLMTLK